jgi:hypothetical protein
MKIKNFQVFDEMNQAAVNELMKNDLVGATALKVVKAARKLDELLADINKSVQIIREKYTVKDVSGCPIHPVENGVVLTDRIKISDPVAFNKELGEILNVENNIDIEMVTEEEIKGVKISPKNIMILSWLIKS